MPIPKTNDYTAASQYQYEPSNYRTQGTRAQVMGDYDLSVDRGRENMTHSISMPGSEFYSAMRSDDIGVVEEVRDINQDNFMKILFRDRTDNTTYNNAYLDIFRGTTIEYAAQYESKPLMNMWKEGYKTQVPVEYLPLDNGGQLRKWGMIVGHATRDEGFRRIISNYTIQAWDDNENTGTPGATAIPAPVSEETTVLHFPDVDAGFFASGQCDCQPLTGKCSNGYRIAWILKKMNTTPGSVPVREMVAITNVEANALGDGGVALTIRRGLGRRNINDAGTAFTEGLPVVITAGDTIVFGPVVTSTQCKPQVCCTKAYPKPFFYCSVAQESVDCVYEDGPHARFFQAKDEFSWALNERMVAAQKIRDFMFRLYHTIVFGQHTYGAGNKTAMVVDDLGNVEYSECDVIPHTTRGVLQTIDQYGFSDEHYFTSCGDQCGQYKLARIHQLRMRSLAASRMIKKPGWIMVGDVKDLAKYQASLRSTNFIADNPATAQLQQNMNNSGFNGMEVAKSLFGSYFDTNIDNVEPLRFMDQTVVGIEDSNFKYLGMENVMYWLNVDYGLHFFAPDVEGLVKKSGISANDPYFPSLGVRNTLTPYLYSQSLVPTQNIMTGAVEMKSKKDCGYRVDAYMWYGVHVKPAYLVQSGRFKYGAKVENPAYNSGQPEGPNNRAFTYEVLSALGCSCGEAETAISNAYSGWANTNTVYIP